jgi:hypothetical protein
MKPNYCLVLLCIFHTSVNLYKKTGHLNVLHIPAFLVPWWLAYGQALSHAEWTPDVAAAFDLQNLEDLPIQL